MIYGLDFTSAPSKRKPITCAVCALEGNVLRLDATRAFTSFVDFEQFLQSKGPWLAGIDAPFGQPRTLIENLGLSQTWAAYVEAFAALGKPGFVELINDYKAKRKAGDKEHLRTCDALTGAISPMKLSFVPVGKMFFELAPRLLASRVHIPPLKMGDESRVVLETYPGVLVRSLLGRVSYKNDTPVKQTVEQKEARVRILKTLEQAGFQRRYGLMVSLTIKQKEALIQDSKADTLDALLCAIQAAWAFSQANHGIPEDVDGLEGWIADPALQP